MTKIEESKNMGIKAQVIAGEGCKKQLKNDTMKQLGQASSKIRLARISHCRMSHGVLWRDHETGNSLTEDIASGAELKRSAARAN